MPKGGRGRSGSRGRSFFGSSPRRNTTTAQAPQRSAPTNAPAQSSGGIFSGFGGMIAQGMAFGAGSEVAHQAVRGIMGGNSHAPQQVIEQQATQQYAQQGQQGGVCQFESTQFMNCLKDNDNAINFCQSYFDMFKQCQGK